MKTGLLSIWLAVVMIFMAGNTAYAAAADTGFSDVDAGAWYANAVAYCRDNGIMSGTSSAAFSPDTNMTRAMMATLLWRMEGSPTVGNAAPFADVRSGEWYNQAVAWAVSEGIVGGYSAQAFGTNDPVTREQMAALLSRYSAYKGIVAGTSASPGFADVQLISEWALSAVTWAANAGIIVGKPGNLFDPKGGATRAETAVILHRYLTAGQTKKEPPQSADTGSILVAYFSRTGNTRALANTIHEISGGDLFEIVPAEPYPSDYNECLERARRELENDHRPVLSTHVADMDKYDIIFVGHPIWHGNAPMAIRAFLEEYDLSEKTIVPFVTSGSSGFGQSWEILKPLCPGSTILEGLAVRGADAANIRSTVSAWIGGLGTSLPRNDEQITTEPGDLILFQGNALVIYYAPNS
jgi:flavodoxin